MFSCRMLLFKLFYLKFGEQKNQSSRNHRNPNQKRGVSRRRMASKYPVATSTSEGGGELEIFERRKPRDQFSKPLRDALRKEPTYRGPACPPVSIYGRTSPASPALSAQRAEGSSASSALRERPTALRRWWGLSTGRTGSADKKIKMPAP